MLAIYLLPLLPCKVDMNTFAPTLSEANELNSYSLVAAGGDAITAGHALAGAWLAGHVLATESPSTSELAVHVLASISDGADGRIKRWCYVGASRLIAKIHKTELPQSTDKITENQWEVMNNFGIVDRPGFDHWVDKGYIYALSPAIAARELRNGHSFSAGLIALNLATIVPRDILRSKQKNELKELGGDNHASRLGKYKTLLQNIGIGVFLSPLERYKLGRALGVGILSVSTVMGLNDYRHNRSHVQYARLHPIKTAKTKS